MTQKSIFAGRRFRRLAVAGLLSSLSVLGLTSSAVAVDYVRGQTSGMQKCVRVILGGYEVKGVKVFSGHKFNCKPIRRLIEGAPLSRRLIAVELSHDRFGKDDQIQFIFERSSISSDVYVAGTLEKRIFKGKSWKSLPHWKFKG